MSTSLISFFTFLTQQVTIYLGLFITVVGLLGGILNIIVFLSLQTFRRSSCAFYLTAMSFANIAHLSINLIPHIVVYGFGIDLLGSSLFYCKMKGFLVELCLLTSLTCMCAATFDQFLATTSNPFWHRWNKMNIAVYVLIGTILTWILHGIPFLFYYDLIQFPYYPDQKFCLVTNTIFQWHLTFGYTCILMGILPLMVMILFGLLAYHNVRNIMYRAVPLVRRELDKQLTQMVLVQVMYNIFVLTPFIIAVLVSFSLQYNDLMIYIVILAINVHNLYFASPFYIYVCVSKRFRQQFVHVFYKLHFNRIMKTNISHNQVVPQTDNTSMNHGGN